MGQPHQSELDGLRGVAILVVVLVHYGFIAGGYIGVDLFFVLSGFLITRILWATRERQPIQLVPFFVRRARRLLPAFLLMLAAYVLLAPLLQPGAAGHRWKDALTAGLYVKNLTGVQHGEGDPLLYTWSLAVEAQFYLLWPLLIDAVYPRKRLAVGLIFGLWLFTTAVRSLAFLGEGHNLGYFALHGTGMMLGALVALAGRPMKFGWLALVGIVALSFVPHNVETQAWTIVAAELLGAVVILNPPRVLRWAPLVWLGGISYGVYLWHPLALWAVKSPVAALPLTVLVAAASYYGVERHFLQQSHRPQAALAPAS